MNGSVTNPGHAPVLVEPVTADITIGRPFRAINILDADGKETGNMVNDHHGTFTIDTGRDKTIYYEVSY